MMTLIGFLTVHILSIVPVLWEDNLPQIAIESIAYGVPVLAKFSWWTIRVNW